MRHQDQTYGGRCCFNPCPIAGNLHGDWMVRPQGPQQQRVGPGEQPAGLVVLAAASVQRGEVVEDVPELRMVWTGGRGELGQRRGVQPDRHLVDAGDRLT